MRQLRDVDLVERIVLGDIVKKGLPEPYCNMNRNDLNWFGKESPVQPASLDLHVGDIFIPEMENRSQDYYCLRSGNTVVVTTSEELNLKANVSGFGFPPDKLSQKGILMVNLGHIDPGWQGCIKFVLINVGKEDFPIKKGDIVSTFLFFELDGDVKKDYVQRRPNTSFPLSPDAGSLIEKLSKDFLNIDKRADLIVKNTVKRIQWINSFIATLTVLVITALGLFYNHGFSDKINRVELEVNNVKKDYDYAKLKCEMDSLKKELQKVRDKKSKK